MDLWQTFRVLVRRWYVVVPLLTVTALVARQAYRGAQPGYTVSSNVILLPPARASVLVDGQRSEIDVNPYLSLDAGSSAAAQALAITADSNAFRSTLPGQARLAAYGVTVAPRSSILSVSVEGTNLRQALGDATAVIQGINAELSRQQTSLPDTQRLTLSTLSAPDLVKVSSARLRAAVVAVVAGLLLTLVLAFVVESLSLAMGRAGKRRRLSDEATSGDPGETVTPTDARPAPALPGHGSTQPVA